MNCGARNGGPFFLQRRIAGLLLRHLLPPGESQWTLDLTTNQMKITQNNVSSTMIFGTEGNNRLFRFLLPSAAGEPGRDSFYDNMWRSSTELFYVMYKVGD